MSVAEIVYTVLLKPPLLRSAANSLLRAMVPKEIQRHGATIVLNPSDPVVSGALALRVYEKAETKFLLRAIRSGDTFLDIGANVGYYSALACAVTKGNVTIVAVEPDPESFKFLQKTLAKNAASKKICANKAVAESPGRMRLYTSSTNRGDNRLYENELSDGSCEVETITVDEMLAQEGIAAVDVIKMDVQGFEGRVLKGMGKTLSSGKELVLMTEYWPMGLERAGSDPMRVLEELEATGLTLYELTARGTVRPLGDKRQLIERFDGRKYTNIVAARGPRLGELVEE